MSFLDIAAQVEDGEESAEEKINGRFAVFVFMSNVTNLVLI